jgi:hypothetical protein
VKPKFTRGEGLLQGIGELTAKDLAEYRFREKELRVPGSNPTRVIRGQTSVSDNTVDMGMMLEFLIPGMKDAEETDVGAEMPGIFGDFQKRLSARPEQQTVDDLFVLQGQWRQFVRECENDMGIARGQQFGTPRVKPAVAGIALAPGAMPVSARIERDGLMAAARTLVDMATQRGRTAAQDGREHFQVQPREPCGMPVDESVSCGEYDIGQFKEWPVHLYGLAALSV